MDITMLLVDDEAIDLEWMRVRIEKGGYPGLHIAGTAKSGFTALAVMEQERIDIIVSDIRMPIMSGMEFARKAKEINPDVHLVFISGHKDFDYAKEAIQLNAVDYLLKPVDDGELARTVAGLCAKIREERRSRSTATEALPYVQRELLLRWFREAAPGPGEERLQAFLAPYLEQGAFVALLEADDWERHAKEKTVDERRELLTEVEAFLRGFVKDADLGHLMNGFDNRFVLLALGEAGKEAQLGEMIRSFGQAFPLTITAGAGATAHTREALHESYRQAEAALSIKWVLGKNRVIRDAAPWRPVKAAEDAGRFIDEMMQAMLDYDLVKIDDCLINLFQLKSGPLSKSEAYDRIIRITSKLHSDLQRMGESLYELLNWGAHRPDILFEFETMQDIVSWLRRRFFELSELLFMKRRKQDRRLIVEMMDYVEERLEHKVTLKDVAARFDFSPNYLGHLFKVETGMAFSDYLNEVRMKRACTLLGDPRLKVYEIADRIGYKNIIYFNRMFKQMLGMTPGEYRKKNNI
ncbi:MAG: DNA-binding response regulator [Paenibacillaceae bacterium]|jgi:two-component system response regulator YesN|nr:DNA-binding response regulator [Paenibacillaceae bacterium]